MKKKSHTYSKEITPNIIDLKKQLEEKKKSKKEFLRQILGKDIDGTQQTKPSAAFANAPRYGETNNCLPLERFVAAKQNVSKIVHDNQISAMRRKTFSIYDKELTPGPGTYYQPTLPGYFILFFF